MRYTLSQIRGSLPEATRAFDRKFPWNHYVTRQLSYGVAWALLPLGVTANQVTFLSLLFVLAGAGALGFGYAGGAAAGVILLNVFWVLDGADGNMARVTGTSSLYGKLLDGKVGMTMGFLPYVGLGICLYRTPDDVFTRLTGIDPGPTGFLLLGFSTALLVLLKYVLQGEYTVFLHRSGNAGVLADGAGRIHPASVPPRLRWAHRLYVNLISGQQGLWCPWLLAAGFTRSLSCFVVYYAAAALVDVIVTEAWHFHRIRRTLA